jgi:hypothetical protein
MLSLGETSIAADDVVPMEFIDLPEIIENPPQDSHNASKGFVVQSVFSHAAVSDNQSMQSPHEYGDRLRMRAYVKGNVGSSSKVASLVNRIESKLRQPSADRTPNPIGNASAQRPKGAIRSTRAVDVPSRAEHNQIPMSERCNAASASSDATETMFATHDAWGFWGH